MIEIAFKDADKEEVDKALISSKKAFETYSKLPLASRAEFLHTIATQLSLAKDSLVEQAHKETNLEKPRLSVELDRTIFQLTSYANACKEGTWLDIRIDTGDNESKPSKYDLRKILVPLGPVVVFGASNFPFAYSTAGGDLACALAAGCTVLIKAHPAHAFTSEMVADVIRTAGKLLGLPDDVFIHLHGAAFETGKALVLHPLTAAVAFTGSFEGGKALFDLANNRPVPIPVFAEMGSVNPVFFLPEIMKEKPDELAKMFSLSITQSAGQFCTNPGILVAIENKDLECFSSVLSDQIKEIRPALMLHPGIASAFIKKRNTMLLENGVSLLAQTKFNSSKNESIPTIMQVAADVFLTDPLLRKEVFGPFSLLVKCRDYDQMLQVAEYMEGQLTATIMAKKEELGNCIALKDILLQKCGRLIYNGVPTGVQVSLGMHHGGPFPATTDSRFTAVGADGIKRFSRPLCYQGWPNDLLPEELKNENPLNLWRTVNNELTKESIVLH